MANPAHAACIGSSACEHVGVHVDGYPLEQSTPAVQHALRVDHAKITLNYCTFMHMEPRLISRRKDTYDVTDAASNAKLLRSSQLAAEPAICDPVAAATACAVAAHVADTACHPASKASCGQVVAVCVIRT
jgi:hypothetical protein